MTERDIGSSVKMSYVTRLEPLFAALTVFLKSVIKSGCGLGTNGWD